MARKHLAPLITLALLASAGSPGQAATWVVKVDGSGDAPTIQSAVSQATSGDVIWVGPGTYYEDIFITGKDLTLKSQQGYASTILNGSLEDSSVVVFVDEDFHSVLIRGFTITGGSGTTPSGSTSRGGGIYAEGYFKLRIESCRIVGNTAEFGGGGYIRGDIFLYPGIPECTLISSIIEDNDVWHKAGGFYFATCSAEVRSNVFRNNYSPFDAGGINIQGARGASLVTGNSFWDNEALDKGGAIQVITSGLSSGPVIEFNLFVGNKASGQDGPDIGTGAAILLDTEVGGIVRNNTIAFNDGTGVTGCSGGALAFFSMDSPLEIRENIIANNLGCGIACYSIPDPSQIIMGDNLYWQNSGGNISSTIDPCPVDWDSTIVVGDPMFCDTLGGNFRVVEGSAALIGPTLFGAFLTAGCDSTIGVPGDDPSILSLALRIKENPVAGNCQMEFTVPQSGYVTVEVLDINGRNVQTLFRDQVPMGSQILNWDTRNSQNHPVAAGVYFIRLATSLGSRVEKLVVAP